ncbi:MAG: hypothetical protein ACOWWO_17795 [Peptococcaceae bacterium]
MRRKMRNEDFIYGKTRRDTEFAEEFLTKNTKNIKNTTRNENVDVKKFANNPRPKYEIFPGE